MAKRNVKQNAVVKNGVGVSQTHYEENDDLLPPADELIKYQQIDPNFVQWIMSRCDKEQDGRIDFNKERIGLVKKHNSYVFRVEMGGLLLFSFITLVLSGMSFILIREDHTIMGSVFGGTAALSIIKRAFTKGRQREKNGDES